VQIFSLVITLYPSIKWHQLPNTLVHFEYKEFLSENGLQQKDLFGFCGVFVLISIDVSLEAVVVFDCRFCNSRFWLASILSLIVIY
jgi:hypothetical protein